MKKATTTNTFYCACILHLILSVAACSIHGSFQGLYSYQEKTAERAPGLIQKPIVPICSLVQLNTPVVYAINGIALRLCLEQSGKALVYVWRPKCSSDLCIPPHILQTYCDERQMELFVVAEYYDYETMTLNYPLKRPIFGIDCDYYETQLTKQYIALFMSDLFGPHMKAEEHFYFLFSDGCLMDMSDKLEKLNG